MTVEIGHFGKLTPEQILLDCLNEAKDMEICLVVCGIPSDQGTRYVLANSDGDLIQLVGMAAIAQDALLERLRD